MTYQRLLLPGLALSLFASCGDSSSTTNPQAPAGTPGGGAISGTVGTENMATARTLARLETPAIQGQQVYLWDATHPDAPRDSAATDSLGRYQFLGLPQGTWVVSIARPDFGAISPRLALGPSANRKQDLSIDRWVTGWVRIDTAGKKPTLARILGIPGSLPLQGDSVQVRSLRNQQVELLLAGPEGILSNLSIQPVGGVPVVVGGSSQAWSEAATPLYAWDFNGTTPLRTTTTPTTSLSGGDLRAVDAYQALRPSPSAPSMVDLNQTLGREAGIVVVAWADSLPASRDSGLGTLWLAGSKTTSLRLRNDGRLQIASTIGSNFLTPEGWTMPVRRWVSIGVGLDYSGLHSLWVDGVKLTLVADQLSIGMGNPDLRIDTLWVGSARSGALPFPGAIRELRIHATTPLQAAETAN